MNPIYKFVIPGISNNLLNPLTVSSFDSNNNQTDFIEVVEDETYEFRNNHNESLYITKVILYDDSKTEQTNQTLVSEIEIPTGIQYIRVIFLKTLNPNDLGVFQTPITNYEPYSKNYVHPIYKNDLSFEYALESNQEFYRGKLSGKLTFQMDDYVYIQGQPFDTQFNLIIYISYNKGATWQQYWSGKFWKTDCEIDDDNKTVIVTPNVNDAYIDVLGGMDKEFNLIDLAPVIQPIKFDKRSLIQIYVPDQKVIGCFLSNMWWEQECEPIHRQDVLQDDYHFQLNVSKRIANVSGSMNPQLPSSFSGTPPEGQNYEYHYPNGGFTLNVYCYESGGLWTTSWDITRDSDNVRLWEYSHGGLETAPPYTVTLTPVANSGATGNVVLDFVTFAVFARRLHNRSSVGYNIPNDDLVADNRNYTRVSPVDVSDQIIVSNKLTSTPTEWGIYQPGQYYVMPYNALFGPKRCYPVARAIWTDTSLWFAVSQTSWQTEYLWRTEFELKDAYPIYSVISVLLKQVAPGITHDGTPDYSAFL